MACLQFGFTDLFQITVLVAHTKYRTRQTLWQIQWNQTSIGKWTQDVEHGESLKTAARNLTRLHFMGRRKSQGGKALINRQKSIHFSLKV